MSEEDEKEKVQTRHLSVRRPRVTKLSPDLCAQVLHTYLSILDLVSAILFIHSVLSGFGGGIRSSV